MTLLSIFVIALALAMDAFAVSLSIGLRCKQMAFARTLRIAVVFGGLQCLMPIIGWSLGIRAQQYIAQYDHWVAFILLALVGSHMIMEAWRHEESSAKDTVIDPTKGIALWMLGFATSIDALAVGLSLALLKAEIYTAAIIIGVVCFILSITGLYMGKILANMPALASLGNRAYILGGLVLWILGLKLLYEHGVFS